MNPSASRSPYQDLSDVIRALRGAVGGWGVLGTVLIVLLHQRLGRICGKIERLAQRFEAGRLWRVADRAVGVSRVAADGRVRAVSVPRLPRRFGWLVWRMAYRAAGYGCQLRVALQQPEMVALLRASPQAGRILQPLCRMLAVETALLRPRLAGDAAVVVVDVAPVAKVRVRKPRAPIDWGRIPLPRGVLSAARRQGFGRVPKCEDE